MIIMIDDVESGYLNESSGGRTRRYMTGSIKRASCTAGHRDDCNWGSYTSLTDDVRGRRLNDVFACTLTRAEESRSGGKRTDQLARGAGGTGHSSA
jgi:hypothetical protein